MSPPKRTTKKTGRKPTDKKLDGVEKLMEILRSLDRDYEPIWGSMVKQTLRRVYPGFNESYYGYRTFSDLINEAQANGLIELDYDKERGNYKISLKDA